MTRSQRFWTRSVGGLSRHLYTALTPPFVVFSMLHRDVRLLDPSFVPPTKPDQQLPPISNEVMDLLTEEMENMIIEGNLKKDQDNGIKKNLLDSAIIRGRRTSYASQRIGMQQSRYKESRHKAEGGWRLRESMSPELVPMGTTGMGLSEILDEDELRLRSEPIEGEGSWLRQSMKTSNAYARARSMSC